MPDPEFICLSCDDTYTFESELHRCINCGEYSCPSCGGEISTIEEYDEAMRINSRERE